MSLSDRIRPNCETAPWVIEEVNQLESRCQELQAENQVLRNKINQLNECLEDVCCGATMSCVIL